MDLALVCGLLALGLGLAFLYFFVLAPAWSPLRAIPGPAASHIIFGNLKEIIDTKWANGHYPEPGLKWTLQYGGAVHYRAFLSHRILLTDPEALKHVFLTHGDTYPRDPTARRFLSNLTGGDGLLSSEGDVHTGMRKLLMPHFGYAKVKTFVDVFQHHTAHLMRHLDTVVASGASVDMHDLFTKLTLDVIGVSAFGYNFESLAGSNSTTLEAYHMMNNTPSLAYFVGSLILPGFKHYPLPRLVKMKRAKAILFKVVDDVIAKKLAHPRDIATDLLDLMLDESTQTDHKVSAAEARVHVLTFLLAGHETTSTTLAWVFTLLAQHPEAEAKARAEARAVQKAYGSISYAALGDLKYISAVIHETLRIFPTITTLASRIADADDHIPLESGKPIFVPKGTTIVANTGVMHRNPLYWSRPTEFLPDRFLDDSDVYLADKGLRGGRGNTFFYMPFSAGAKNCIGMRFATAELQVVVATLLTQFSFALAPEANTNPKLSGVSLKPVQLTMHVNHA
ncbi:hypothetical protein SDRG_07813 [Saprolegnia diclina VS20]|uniref:Cytochrome P450 n=1 Tax=Saprolegnia diclina (strain VS20) TaxID=1156394 RepID=T0QL23_SAPDV|nr:hypothetical protein SDRG_07813 [Saprolegnia diclina VS20]EQC34485.1 hypothetical protein SDRG_07813 [Saprolegnia diclina VS20]|eukprot:XP_008611891.1 hypothetical protein SDRG_07813 [Saprolegnia diclina VS20]